ncbi:MAG: chemotaxis protein CheW [Thermodesulfobacteriota bacterium]
MQSTAAIKQKNLTELVTFYIGSSLCGIDITDIQEINKQTNSLTWVPKAPDYVVGVLNLRGMIVTILDLGKKLGLSPLTRGKNSRNIIVHFEEELVGIMVDEVSEVLSAKPENIDPAPANLGGVQGTYFSGVLKTDKHLIGILDIKKALADE